MRLQQLEIAGFKSFSDRSHLSFDRGVTAIVGASGTAGKPSYEIMQKLQRGKALASSPTAKWRAKSV